MAYTTLSHIDGDRTPSGLLQAIRDFTSAWVQTSAAYSAYSALSTKSDAQLAARGLDRRTLARSAMDLPTLIRE